MLKNGWVAFVKNRLTCSHKSFHYSFYPEPVVVVAAAAEIVSVRKGIK